MPAPRVSTTRWTRRSIQFALVALMAYLGIRHQLGGGAPLDSFCPFGAIETAPSLLGGTGFIGKIGTSNLVLLGSLALVTLGLSGSFCGWLCPFGAIQDWLGSVRRRLFGRSFVIPEALHRYLRHARWVVLALIVFMSYRSLSLWFAEYDPYRAFFHFKFETPVAYALIAATLLLGLLVERFWCLYLCPLGALVGGLGLIGLTRVQRSGGTCTDCSLCSRACPSRIPVHTIDVVRNTHCTMCAECVDACPSHGALSISTGAPKESFRPVAVGIATLVLFFALIATGWALGLWQTGSGCGGCAEESVGASTVVVSFHDAPGLDSGLE